MNRSRTPKGNKGSSYHPFEQLQKILDKQQAKPIRSSPVKEKQPFKESGLILNRKKVENKENTVKRMYPQVTQSNGYTWEDLIKRTSTETIINSKVNVSDARKHQPTTSRCIVPDHNKEEEQTNNRKRLLTPEQRKNQVNRNLIAGESVSAIDHRVRNKNNWKIGLINRYENNQDMWGEQTNAMVNRLKQEADYIPERDYKPDQNDWVDERLARKLEIMEEQCHQHRDNMRHNPITGLKDEQFKPSGKRKSTVGDVTGRSDIHHLHGTARKVQDQAPKSGKKIFAEHHRVGSQINDYVPNPRQSTRQALTPQRGTIGDSRALTPTRRSHRDRYAAQNNLTQSLVVLAGGKLTTSHPRVV